ncbi:Methyltransferase type 11 OS=Tsukamurella paurometabola (strain ATCC 8368 / DSM / CCUG 35730/ CIP 100753 / JCM 10117 / KCTC 9821 / NBRC 16120 / NCIMB 702349/ NCTC 13040) OX=521096 GN=Tpau_4001 PE=4 SV=1 [Tsukamurella paurometabola]|uniref:Methyltransferase type 11 n=1 Tax=Tsukamurella paurometabola (strain ATCC 8368 / DSM 20162 / CCUG 35730 / CIP 100753 / JCM 10117 / KCTC 9821 / NBRC 16120 / NCIMB 702349 / NCTC 13040) TaxID=521096 RepID=D5UN77_TSUPD|nr:class I SAM-dependent methyltransferase [Tsukamurella paurometabola]ADG80572.1 Methyltransferase type 11 [Tsukamurella paurometabola DSM 20162]SUP40138.1 trans-aconitate 2-methyltransferase [Tsukamurella paurometabola]
MAELHEDRHRALSFGAIADAYDRLRPRYADVTVDAISAGAATAVDVGAGTGILSRQLRDRGLDVLVVEPDAAMAEVARGSGVPAEVATFEDWDAAGRTYDLVTFGQSWHWVDADIAVPRLAGLLNPGGRVALLWNKLRPTTPSNAELRAASADYINVDAVSADPTQAEFALAELGNRFTDAGFTVRTREDAWTETQTAERWLDLIFTYSAHSTLPDDRKAALRSALAGVIGDRDVELGASTIALIAQR